jgi:hypothetical protein
VAIAWSQICDALGGCGKGEDIEDVGTLDSLFVCRFDVINRFGGLRDIRGSHIPCYVRLPNVQTGSRIDASCTRLKAV